MNYDKFVGVVTEALQEFERLSVSRQDACICEAKCSSSSSSVTSSSSTIAVNASDVLKRIKRSAREEEYDFDLCLFDKLDVVDHACSARERIVCSWTSNSTESSRSSDAYSLSSSSHHTNTRLKTDTPPNSTRQD